MSEETHFPKPILFLEQCLISCVSPVHLRSSVAVVIYLKTSQLANIPWKPNILETNQRNTEKKKWSVISPIIWSLESTGQLGTRGMNLFVWISNAINSLSQDTFYAYMWLNQCLTVDTEHTEFLVTWDLRKWLILTLHCDIQGVPTPASWYHFWGARDSDDKWHFYSWHATFYYIIEK